MVILVFLYFSFVQRTKNLRQAHKLSRLEAIYETESELSRKIHDEHGARLNQTMIMVQNDASKSHVLDSLELLYNHSRDLAREINDVDTGPNYWNGLLGMLTFRTPKSVKLFKIYNAGKMKSVALLLSDLSSGCTCLVGSKSGVSRPSNSSCDWIVDIMIAGILYDDSPAPGISNTFSGAHIVIAIWIARIVVRSAVVKSTT
mgnify:CR=1 FL=1